MALIAAVAIGDLGATAWRAASSPAALGWRGIASAVLALAVAALAVVLVARRQDRARWDPPVLIGALGLLVGLRTIAVILIDAPLIVDWRHYHELAVQIAEGGAWFASRPTGYPMLLAGLYALFGPHPWLGELLNVGLGAAGGLLVYWLALQLSGSRAAGLAALLYAIAPAQVLMTTVLGSEIAHGVLLLAILAVVIRWPASALAAVAAGALLGASQYVRSTSMLLAPIVMAWSALAWDRWPSGLARAAALAAAFLLVLAPVLVWNAARGSPSLATSSFLGWQLLVGASQEHDGRYNVEDAALVTDARTELGDPASEERAYRFAADRYRDDPAGVFGLWVRKFPILWGDDHYGARWALYASPNPSLTTVNTLALLSQLAWAATAAFAALAVWAWSRPAPTRGIALLVVIVAAMAIAHLPLEANPRYHSPLVPIFCVLAGVGLAIAVGGPETGFRSAEGAVQESGHLAAGH
jgi:4-amino-4-deoxy-L-arabinose transferase-like glycosyltransferase